MKHQDSELPELFAAFYTSQLRHLEIDFGGTVVTLDRSGAVTTIVEGGRAPAPLEAPQVPSRVREAVPVRAEAVGIFRPAPSCESGAHVGAGDTLGAIEARGVAHPVVAGVDGRISEVLSRDGDVVGYGHTLVRVEEGAP